MQIYGINNRQQNTNFGISVVPAKCEAKFEKLIPHPASIDDVVSAVDDDRSLSSVTFFIRSKLNTVGQVFLNELEIDEFKNMLRLISYNDSPNANLALADVFTSTFGKPKNWTEEEVVNLETEMSKIAPENLSAKKALLARLGL